MKYIDAEKLIAEIQRLHAAHSGEYGCDEVRLNLEYLEDFIISLQQEQPEEKKNCNDCPHCVDRKDQNGWHFKGCFGGPYKGKFIAEIDKCPLQQDQPNNVIQWTGNNLKEVIEFTGKSPRFGEWFKSWEEYENYVHSHNDILKLFCEDGSHFEVPVGAWIVKTPDGYNVPSVTKYIQYEQPEVDLNEEVVSYIEQHFHIRNDETLEVGNDPLTTYDFEEIARHFYELGLKARKK